MKVPVIAVWLTLACTSLVAAQTAAATKDLSGTWVGKLGNGDNEIVYRFKSDNGKITGTQTLPFGDWPIVDGKVEGDDIELTVETESFGDLQKRTIKGKIVGDEIHITPAFPAPRAGGPGGPGGSGGPGGPGGMGPGGPPPGGPGAGPGGPGGPGGGMRRMFGQPVVLKRGTPTPSYRPGPVDYKSLAKVELPVLRDIPYNGLAKTPPMGWNSWNKFRTRFDDKTVREIADAMVTTGMRDAGYQFINIDDGWQWKRDEKGVLQPNPNFPNMKALADYVHSKGLKLGIYSSPGPRTCANFEGSYGHEEIDAKTWADWGIDYLKYDWCSASRIWKDEDMQAVYQRMGDALRKTGRPIVFSLCQYGRAKVQEWGPKVGGNLWRSTGDIRDEWASMQNIGFSQSDLAPYAAPGHWNDPDMLEVGNGGMTPTENQTHFSLWALLAAPLIAGNDIRNLDAATKDILLNKEVISINQDVAGKAGYRVGEAGDTEVWVKPLNHNQWAIGLFNKSAEDREISVKWSDLKLTGAMKVRDLWARADRASATDQFSTKVPSHGVVLVRLSK